MEHHNQLKNKSKRHSFDQENKLIELLIFIHIAATQFIQQIRLATTSNA